MDTIEQPFPPLVSIIIPAYNAEAHIKRALTSCAAQTHPNVEVLVVDDGSTDNTADVIRGFSSQIDRLWTTTIPNNGQGAARNLAMRQARGDYVFFLDADDELLPDCISTLVKQALISDADVVMCDWRIYGDDGGFRSVGTYVERLKPGLLSDGQRLWLLGQVAFATIKLYSANWLKTHNIQYAEGHLYEDVIVYAGMCLEPARVCYVPRPLYVIHAVATSSTRRDYSTDRHAHGFISAIRQTMARYGTQIAQSPGPFLNHCLGRVWLYSVHQHRIPMRLWLTFAANVLQALAPLSTSTLRISRHKKWALQNVERNPTVAALEFYIGMRLERIKFVKKQWKRLKKRTHTYRARRRNARRTASLQKYWRRPIDNGLILCHGFNNVASGNTLAMLQILRYTHFRVVVLAIQPEHWEPATNIHFVERTSDEYLQAAACASIHLLETWCHPSLRRKRLGTCWIQMWHGTPIKKLLYESEEIALMTRHKNHKRRSGRDVVQWDYLLSQNRFGTEKLTRAFELPPRCILEIGYPRTDIFFNADRTVIRQNIRVKYGADKPILLYAPTWRDYNRYLHTSNMKFLLDLPTSRLSESYTVIALPHPFLRSRLQSKDWHIADDNVQELLISADALITDYSSILFDWLLMNKPFVLLWKDMEIYNFLRGIYSEIKNDFSKFITQTDIDCGYILKKFPGYNNIKNISKYIRPTTSASSDLLDFIEKSIKNNANETHSNTLKY